MPVVELPRALERYRRQLETAVADAPPGRRPLRRRVGKGDRLGLLAKPLVQVQAPDIEPQFDPQHLEKAEDKKIGSPTRCY